MFLIFCFNWKTTSTVCVLYSFWSTFTLALISSSTLYSSSTTNSLTTAPPTTMVSVSNRLLILMFCYCIYLQVPFLSYPLLLYTIVVHQEKTCLPTAACMGRMVGMTRRDSRGRDNEVSEESSPSTCWWLSTWGDDGKIGEGAIRPEGEDLNPTSQGKQKSFWCSSRRWYLGKDSSSPLPSTLHWRLPT